MQNTDLSIFHTDEIFGIPIKGRSLRCDEHAIGADTDYERRTIARHNKLIGNICAHDTQAPSAIAPRQGFLRGFLDRAPISFVNLADEFGDYFGISLAQEFMSPRLKITSEIVGIVDRAVVDQGYFPRGIKVGVCVFIRFTTVCCPACMSDADAMTFRSHGALSDELNAICIFSNRCILSDRLWDVHDE